MHPPNTLDYIRKEVMVFYVLFFFFQAEDGIRDYKVTGVQTCALPIFAALDDGGATLLVADGGGGVSTDERDVLRAVSAAHGLAVDVPREQYDDALRRLDVWWASRRASLALDLCRRANGSARTRALSRLASIAARAPRHERPRVTRQVEL